MIDCAIDQACLPGKSDKRNIYPPSSSSKPPVMDEHGAECKINLPNTTISGLKILNETVFCFFFPSTDFMCDSQHNGARKKTKKKKKNGTRLKLLPAHRKKAKPGQGFFFCCCFFFKQRSDKSTSCW